MIKIKFSAWDDEYGGQIGVYCNKKDTRKLEQQILQGQKLLELIEKRVRERTLANTIFINTDFYADLTDDLLTKIFQALLEESKKK